MTRIRLGLVFSEPSEPSQALSSLRRNGSFSFSSPIPRSNPPSPGLFYFAWKVSLSSFNVITRKDHRLLLPSLLQNSMENHRKRWNLFLFVGQFCQLFSVLKEVSLLKILDYLQKIGFFVVEFNPLTMSQYEVSLMPLTKIVKRSRVSADKKCGIFPFFRSTDLWHSLSESGAGRERAGELDRQDPPPGDTEAPSVKIKVYLLCGSVQVNSRAKFATWHQRDTGDTSHTPQYLGAKQVNSQKIIAVFILIFYAVLVH